MTVGKRIHKGQKTREYVDLHARRQAEGGGWRTEKNKNITHQQEELAVNTHARTKVESSVF